MRVEILEDDDGCDGRDVSGTNAPGVGAGEGRLHGGDRGGWSRESFRPDPEEDGRSLSSEGSVRDDERQGVEKAGHRSIQGAVLDRAVVRGLAGDLMVNDDPPPRSYSGRSSGFDDMENDWPPPASYREPTKRAPSNGWGYGGWDTGRRTAAPAKMNTMMETYGEYTLKQALNNMPHLAGIDFIVRELCRREHMRGGDRGVLRLLDHIQSLTLFDVTGK